MALSGLARTTFRTTPFFSGTSSTSALVPGFLPVAIGGRAYLIDPEQYERQTLEVLRVQADQSGEPSESSLNPKGLWRRSQESWHHGAGQNLLDRTISGGVSDRARYRTSKGINPWTEGQASLLNDTANRRSSVNTNLYLAVAGSFFYVSDGTEVHHTTDPSVAVPTWTAAVINAGQGAQTVQSIASNGSFVWAALGTSGLHRTVAGEATSTLDVPAAPASGQVSLVGWANGYLLAAGSAGTSATRQNSLWQVTGPLDAVPALSLIKTHADTSFVWAGIGPGRNVVYAWGNSGTNGEVYKVTYNADTGTLSAAASFATYLPDGEQILDLTFYAGNIILATSKGIRLGSADSAGNIDYGPLIATTSAARALEPQDRYVWFAMTNRDTVSTGLGRVDLGYFTDQALPAWAPDLMATAQGAVLSAATFSDRRYFTVSGVGLFGETATKVASGTFETGAIRFGTSENKTARSVEVRHHALKGTIEVEVKTEGGGWTDLGASSDQGSAGPPTPLSAHSIVAETVELRFTLTRSTTDTAAGPELVRWTLRALPTPARNEIFALPIILRSRVDNGAGDGQVAYFDVRDEYAYLKGLESSGKITTLQLGLDTFEVYVDRVGQKGLHWSSQAVEGRREFIEGTVLVLCQTVVA